MAYLRLIRPLNVLIAFGAVFVASFIAVGTEVSQGNVLIPVMLACFAAGLVTAAGNVLNDYSDRESDVVNHPERPIPSGQITPSNALSYSVALFVLSLPLALMVNIECFVLATLNIVVLVTYEGKYKRRGISGNLEVSWLTGSIFIFGGLAAYQGDFENLTRTLYLAMLAFFATLGREVAKDIQDVVGDTDRQTLPRRIGVEPAAQVAGLAFALAVLFSIPPPFMGLMNYGYLAFVLLADVIFIYCTTLLIRNPARASNVAKIGMILALFAFLVGGL